VEIKIEPHTLEREEERGTNRREIEYVLENGFEIPARGNRKGKAKIFEFKRERLGKFYEQKRVEVIYVEENDSMVTVTVSSSTENGRTEMQVVYNAKTDVLYIRLDESKQEVINQRISDDIVLDVGKDDKIVGIEITDASLHTNLQTILPVKFQVAAGVSA
jgi:uncharacterized protein YuzE